MIVYQHYDGIGFYHGDSDERNFC